MSFEQQSSRRRRQRLSALPGKRVAVVDDNNLQARSMATLLEMMGYQARVAYDGESAIRMIMRVLPASGTRRHRFAGIKRL